MFFAAIAIVVALVFAFWLGPEFARGRVEQAAVQGVKGVVAVDTTWTGVVVEVHLKAIDGEALKKLNELNLPDLASIKATNCKLADKDFTVFAKFPKLRFLDLTGTPVSDTAVDHLAKLTGLKHLVLKSTGVEFKQVDRIQKASPKTKVDY